uniref:Uncharacterized protein n=1 Tax=Timema genevievae TaxID=629358 RepID=A0A7R9JNI8_TIMGE|nr:unnamed protein product [Timema genevievae]
MVSLCNKLSIACHYTGKGTVASLVLTDSSQLTSDSQQSGVLLTRDYRKKGRKKLGHKGSSSTEETKTKRLITHDQATNHLGNFCIQTMLHLSTEETTTLTLGDTSLQRQTYLATSITSSTASVSCRTEGSHSVGSWAPQFCSRLYNLQSLIMTAETPRISDVVSLALLRSILLLLVHEVSCFIQYILQKHNTAFPSAHPPDPAKLDMPHPLRPEQIHLFHSAHQRCEMIVLTILHDIKQAVKAVSTVPMQGGRYVSRQVQCRAVAFHEGGSSIIVEVHNFPSILF